MSILYPATLLNLLTSASSWCVTSLGCSVYTVTSSAWHDNITSFLPIWTPFTCVLFFWLLWLGFPISCWIEVELVGILICFRLQWEGNQLVTSEHYVGCGLVLHCFFPSLLWEKCLWWMDVKLYEMLFLHLWCDLGLFLCWCAGSRSLICICWNILVSLGWIQLDRGIWPLFKNFIYSFLFGCVGSLAELGLSLVAASRVCSLVVVRLLIVVEQGL